MLDFPILTIIGLGLIIIGVAAWVGGALKIANLEINFETPKGRAVAVFSFLHILVGLIIIVINLMIK